MKKYKDMAIALIIYAMLVVSWYLVGWYASPAFWDFLTAPVVVLVISGSLIASGIWTLVATVLDI